MTKSKHTKRALLASVLSMLLCLSMLIGSTFAWFTDSVTAGKNKIVAGNLDVELEYSATPTDETSWQPVGENTNLFKATEGDNATRWEPGHTEVVYLRVRNAGSLALKYQFSANVFADEAGTVAEKQYTGQNGLFKLSDYLVFRKMARTDVNGRESLWMNNKAEEEKLMGTKAFETIGMEKDLLLPGKTEEITEDEPTIFLGLTLLATQASHEADHFDNTYDAAAEYAKPVSSADDFMEALANGDDVKLMEDIQLTVDGDLIVRQDSVIDLNKP